MGETEQCPNCQESVTPPAGGYVHGGYLNCPHCGKKLRASRATHLMTGDLGGRFGKPVETWDLDLAE